MKLCVPMIFIGVSMQRLIGCIQLTHRLEVPRLPASIKRRLLRTVESQVHEPPFPGEGLDPLAKVFQRC
jgi:hypothetical protein